MIEIPEQEGRVNERCGLREGGHMRGRYDAIVDGDALVHVCEVVFLQSELAVLVGETDVDLAKASPGFRTWFAAVFAS